MPSILNGPLKINGVISTKKTVLQNLNMLADASGCFLTFDINQGKWAVIINRPGTSVASFNDSNIVGSVTVSEKGVTELYNSASIEFPHPDLRDEKDYVDIVVDESEKYPNEIDNKLEIQTDVINNPVQAQYLAGVDLKQSRLNRVITFSTDFTGLGLKAGDLIDVTNSVYGYVAKVFRIIEIQENDEDVIGVTLTCVEYDEDVYDTTGLTRTERTKATGIILREQNTAIQTSNDVDVGNQLQRLLLANAGAFLLRSLFSRLAGNLFGPPTVQARNIDKILANATRPALASISGNEYVCDGASVTVTVNQTVCDSNCLFTVPNLEYDYTITGVNSSKVSTPLSGTVTVNGSTGVGTLTIQTVSGGIAGVATPFTVTIGGLAKGITIYPIPNYTYTTTANNSTITEGNGTAVTLTVTDIPNGTVIPYEITGSATARITAPALTGNVTISGGQATLNITTSNDGIYTGPQTFTVTFNPDLITYCGLVDNEATVTVNDTSSAPPPDTTCEYVVVPIVWCAVYNGADNQMKDVTVRRYAYLPVAQAGEATVAVPTALSITKGNPSTISVTSTVNVAASSSLGGMPIQVIRTFNTVAPKGLITGSVVSTVYGYII